MLNDLPAQHCSLPPRHRSRSYVTFLACLKLYQQSFQKNKFAGSLKSLFFRNLSFCLTLKTTSNIDELTLGIKALIMELQIHSKFSSEALHCQQLIIFLVRSSALENILSNLTVGFDFWSMQALLVQMLRQETVK